MNNAKTNQPAALNYTPQLIDARDALGTTRRVGVMYDRDSLTYVGTIEGGRPRRMASGRIRGVIVATGEAATVSGAVAATIENFITRQR